MARYHLTGVRVAAGVAVFLSLSAQSLRAQSTEDWQSVEKAARQEGRVVVYIGYVTPVHEAVHKAFEAKYGIRVEPVMARPSEISGRIAAEQAAGRYIADLQFLGVSGALRAPGAIQPHGPLPNLSHLKDEAKAYADGKILPTTRVIYGLLLNTDLVKPADEPTSWMDLLGPKWKGKILMDDPRAAGGGRVQFHMTYDRFGRQYNENFAKQEPTFAREVNESARRVARGEFPMYTPYVLTGFSTLSGLPVKYILPAEGVAYSTVGTAVMKNAPRPNAARLLQNFYLSDEAQAIYANSGGGVVVNTLSGKLSPEVDAVANAKLLVAEDYTRYEMMFEEAKRMYDKQ